MPATILESLPGIHVTVIGVGAAFFSAFAIFAYQKMQEAKDQLDAILEEVKVFSTPTNFFLCGQDKLICKDGKLDWDVEAKQLLHHAKSFFSHLDLQQKNSPQYQFSPPDPVDVVETCRRLCTMFHYLFVSYPFTGISIVHVTGVTEKIEETKCQPFDSTRLREIEGRISFLTWCWDTSSRALIELGRKGSELERQRAQQEAVALFDQTLQRMPDLSDEEKQRLWADFYQPHLSHSINFEQIIAEFFNKVSFYNDSILPRLRGVLNTHNLFEDRFKVRATTLNAINFFLVILVFGVVVPMVLGNLNKDFGLTWHYLLDYFLLAVTTAPYFYVCWFLYKRVAGLSFK